MHDGHDSTERSILKPLHHSVQRVAASICLLVFLTPAWALTRAQAQLLPVADLARMVLGELGETIVAVDRPAWPRPSCGGPLCPPPMPSVIHEARPPPPLQEGLTFHQRPTPTLGGVQWTGLCTSLAIEVFYGDDGHVGEVRTHNRYGRSRVANRLVRGGPERDLAKEKTACEQTPFTDGFFFADSEDSAYEASLASRMFDELASKSSPLPFKLDCDPASGPNEPPCSQLKHARKIADRFKVDAFREVTRLPCDDANGLVDASRKTSCLSISSKAVDEQFIVEMTNAIEHPRLVRIEFRKVPPVY